ncbi:MAG: hypothetical protein ACLGIG_05155 [Actinomycetes bacterium]
MAFLLITEGGSARGRALQDGRTIVTGTTLDERRNRLTLSLQRLAPRTVRVEEEVRCC